MSSYSNVRYAIENSRVILADYNQEESFRLHKDVLIEKVSHELAALIKAPRALVLTKLISAVSIGVQPLVDVQTLDGRNIPTSGFFLPLRKRVSERLRLEIKLSSL